MADNTEITYQDCIKTGFLITLVAFMIFIVYGFSMGWYIQSPGLIAFIVLGIGLMFGIVFFTFVIFTPIVYVTKKIIIPKLK